MTHSLFRKWIMSPALAFVVLNSCNPHIPVVTPSAAPPTATSSPASPTPSPTSISITIVGDSEFIRQTQLALLLLQTMAPDAYRKAERYIGIIQQSEKSGMWAYELPPRYAVSAQTAFYSITWYASTIAHDATHSELYHQYSVGEGTSVPDAVWIGVGIERFCNSYQLNVLKRIGGTAQEVDYLAGLAGAHCDIDHDGDCDWDDYRNRTW